MVKVLDEKWLIRFANDLIGVLHVRPEFVSDSDPSEFRDRVEKTGWNLTDYLAMKTLSGTLGTIIGFTRTDTIYSSDWRRTPSWSCSKPHDFPGLPDVIQTCPGKPEQMFLARNARPVIYAAMYDILTTQNMIPMIDYNMGQGLGKATGLPHLPPRALERFVRTVRLSRTHLAA